MNFRILYVDWRDVSIAAGLLEEVWRRIEEERLVESLFYDGSVLCLEGFIREIARDGCLPFAVMGDGELAAFSWLNCITGKAARTHFVIFKKFRGRKLRLIIGPHLYKYILTRRDGMGYLFDCLYGITPKCNPLAWKAALSCGWKESGEIANACYMANERRSVNGIITCATREILNIGEGESWEAVWDA